MSNAQATPQFPPGYLEQDRSYQVVAVGVSFIVINTIATALRAWARHIQKGRLMASDYFMPISLIFNIGICICLLLGAKWGAGKHVQTVPLPDIIKFTYLTYYGMASVYVFAVTFSKLAILDLYLHIFIDRPSRYTTYALGVIMIGSLIGNFVATMAQCTPFANPLLYDPTAGGHCGDIHAHFTWASLPNIVTDFVMMVLPIPVVLTIRQPWQVKVGIWLTFLIGSLGIITAIIRLDIFYTYGWNTGAADPTWIASIIFIWTCVEPGVYHLAACALTFRPLITWIIFESPVSSIISRTRLLSSRSRGSRGTHKSQKPHLTQQGSLTSQPSINSEHRKDLLCPDKGKNVSSITSDYESHSMDDFGQNINVHREIMVSQV